jgi:hypothetical protein
MSFDVFLTAFRNGAAVPADAEAARGVLARYDCRQQPGFNAYGVTFPDGSHVELFATGLDGTGEKPFSGGMFALRGITESVGTLIFEFAAAAGCVAMPAMEQACVLIPRDDLPAHLPADLTADFQAVPVSNGAEVVAALQGGHAAWLAYRNRVVGTIGGGPEGGT